MICGELGDCVAGGHESVDVIDFGCREKIGVRIGDRRSALRVWDCVRPGFNVVSAEPVLSRPNDNLFASFFVIIIINKSLLVLVVHCRV